MSDELLHEATLGQPVRLPGSPPLIGTIMEIEGLGESLVYKVFISADDQRYVPASEAALIEPSDGFRVVERDEFLRRLLVAKFKYALSDVLYSYRGSRTRFEVYQFKPIFKFFGSDRRSLLIADEVGLGKTIEAALIYLELKARSDMPRVLIACPSALREKWRQELKFRFDEDFTLLDSRPLRQFLRDFAGTGGLQRLRGIVSLELMRRPEFQEQFVELDLSLDLLVIDEAHHVRNSETETHKAARLLADKSENVVLLTATPLQTDTEDLFNVLQLIDPGTFDDFSTFTDQIAPNYFVNRAIRALGVSPPAVEEARLALVALQGRPGFARNSILERAQRVLVAAEGLDPTSMVALRRDLLELNSLAYVFNRTRKRDVASTALRNSSTVRVVLAPVERQFYDAMMTYVRRQVRARYGSVSAFAMITRERQAASCLIAARQYLEETRKTHQSDIGLEDANLADEEIADVDPATAEFATIDGLIALSRQIGETDGKFDALAELLEDLQTDARGGKVIIFSFFRRTIEYLRERLVRRGFRVFTIHGNVPVGSRPSIIGNFRDETEPAVLLSTEVGAEGLDFQFADTLVNYDLPWNPMKVEQRIGRIDRYGQKSPKVRIVNLVIDDTIETRVLVRLYERIEIFKNSIGDLEPILGPELQRLTREILSRDLSPEEERQLADVTAQRLVNLRAEQDDFERQRAELMAQDAMFMSDVNDAVSSGRYVSVPELTVAIRSWVSSEFPASELRDVGEGAWLLIADPSLANFYSAQMANRGDKSDQAIAMLRAMQSKLGVPCTFDDVLANERPKLHFIHARHPLARASIDHFRARQLVDDSDGDERVARLEISVDPSMAGQVAFFLNVVQVEGANRQVQFVPVVFDIDGKERSDIASRLLALLQDASRPSVMPVNWTRFTDLQREQHAVMGRETERIGALARDRNEALVDSRTASVERTFKVKISKREQWRAEAFDPRIIRMRDSEIVNLRAQLTNRLATLEANRSVRVSYSLVLGGVLDLVPVTPTATTLGLERGSSAPSTSAVVVEEPAPAGWLDDHVTESGGEEVEILPEFGDKSLKSLVPHDLSSTREDPAPVMQHEPRHDATETGGRLRRLFRFGRRD